ncbi:MAG: EamA family transporter [Opitutaceae bacterium]
MNTVSARPWHIALAFTALYLIWGSTYLAIKIAIETIPPFFMATARFLIAGAILYAIARLNGTPKPTRSHWRHSIIVGALLIAGGNGVVTFAEKSIDSTMAALIIASNPLFMTLLGWWGGVQSKPSLRMCFSLTGGFLGVAILILSKNTLSLDAVLWGNLLVILAVIFWTTGSIYSKRNPQTINPWLQSGMQMICGSLVCLVVGTTLGEFNGFDLEMVSNRSWTAFVYLVIAGSLAGFTSYVYLLKHCTPTEVSSHAYVNPVVAVILGWLVLGETLSLSGTIAAGIILASVYQLLKRSAKPVKK